ncbi:MAG: Ig-like domain-containing protein [Christensenellaceae bacterium]|jgi:hypothetical protein
MKKRRNGSKRRLLALVIAVAIVCAMFPLHALADTVTEFTVQMPLGTLSSTGVIATMTDEGGSSEFFTGTVNNGAGTITFSNMLDDGTTYTLLVSGMTHYADYTATGIDPTTGWRHIDESTMIKKTTQLASFTITPDVPVDGSDITVTLTDKLDQGETMPVTAPDFAGAQFDDLVYPDRVYLLTIQGMDKYEDLIDFEIGPGLGAAYTFATSNLTPDTTPPTVSELSKLPAGWTKQSVDVTGTAEDNCKVEKVYFSTDDNDYLTPQAPPASGGTVNPNPVTGEFTFSISNTASVETVYIWAVDAAGNVSTLYDFDVQIDVDIPDITDITFAKTDTGQALEFLEFGTMTNDDVTVTVVVDDAGNSGVNVELFYNDGTAHSMTEAAAETSLGSEKWEAEFTLSASDFTDSVLYTLSAKAEDGAGNLSAEAVPKDFVPGNLVESDDFMRDKTKPKITITPSGGYDDGTKRWYAATDNIAFDVDWEDTGSGLNEVKVTVNGTSVLTKDILNIDPSAAEADWSEALNTSAHGSLAGTEDIVIVATAKDNVGNTQTETLNLYADYTEPGITNFEITAAGSGSMDARCFQTYGTFFNDKVKVTVTADDAESGVKTIELFGGGASLGPAQTVINGTASFIVPAGAISEGSLLFGGLLAAKATDNVNNTMFTPEFHVKASSAVKSDKLIVETIKPAISATVPAPVYVGGDGKNWYNAPVAFSVTVSDADAGIRSVEMSLNGQALTTDYAGKAINAAFFQGSAATHSESFTIHTSQGVRDADGAYRLKIMVTDNAGNTMETTRVIYIDTAAPVITDFTLEAADVQAANQQDIAIQTDYGYYFEVETRVTVTAQDPAPGSEVKSITYYTVDITGGKSAETTVPTGEKISFIIPASFKGQIFAKATDNVGFTPSQFASPNSLIVESPEKHLEETHIRFRKADTPYTDNTGLELYATDVAVGLTVTDTFSGLRRVEWAITAPYDTAHNAKGSFDIAGSSTLTGDTAGWSITATEGNLVTEMTNTITVQNNSNAIVVWVKITDRSGNTSEEFITFSIDKTAPTISVTYDNNNPDREFTRIYKADRVATIVIYERNFRPEDVEIHITNTDGTIPAISGWTTVWNAANPDMTTNTATVRYSADGDYTFDIRYSDNAKNAAAAFEQHAFTIDQTAPRIAVTYDNNEVVDGLYYAASRTATITITEHNFETSRIQITGRATDDGKAADFPSASSWSSRGDTHTATIRYMDDARYTFTIAYTDKAGNEAAAFEQHEFIVDQTAPALEITGVADKSANNGDVAPVISFSDTNYDASTVSVTLVGATRDAVDPGGRFTDQHNGQIYTFENFERKKEIDDIYMLSASVADRAGNETSKTIAFSVNRFGSVYALDAEVQQIEGKYVQNEVDVVVTETNVDSLRHDTINVKMTYNGIPKDLVEGEDYSVDRSGGEGTWSQYQYIIPKMQFAGDGRYVVTLYSVDAAGNVNENIQESKKTEISFGIDKTPPAIVSIGLENGMQYPVDELHAAISVTDNLVLHDVGVYLNGEKIETQVTADQEFVIPASNSKQSMLIVASDAAGNESTLEISDFLITTSVFYRWYNNTPLFVGSLVAICGIAVLVVLLIRRAVAKKART